MLARCALLLAASLPLATSRVPVTPLRRRTLLQVLRRLTLDAPDFRGDELSIDIGGSLAKVVLFQPSPPPEDGQRPRLCLGSPRLDAELDALLKQSGERELSMYVPQLGGNLHFFCFESKHVAAAAAFLAKRPVWQPRRQVVMRATGAGSYKHQHALGGIGVRLDLSLDVDCMLSGLNFLLHQLPRPDLFTVAMPESMTPLATPGAYRAAVEGGYAAVAHPPKDYIYVSVSTETVVLEAKSGAGGRPTFRRLGASSVGGATFWGLVRLLTACETFDEVIRLTEMEGACSTNVDMQVGDIYGKAAASSRGLGLKSEVIAASFGKVVLERRGPMFFLRYLRALLRHYEEGFWLVVLFVLTSLPGLREVSRILGVVRFAERRAASVSMCGNYAAHDVALSLLRMVSNNIGQIATLYAQQSGLRHIVFGGSFIREHPYTVATISAAVHYFSRGEVQPLFLKHDCFVGAIGAHLKGRESDAAAHGGAAHGGREGGHEQHQPREVSS